jgi:hypothetical protein
MGWAEYAARMRQEECENIFYLKPEGKRDHLEDLGVHEGIILEGILRAENEVVYWINLLSIGSNGGFLYETSGSLKDWVFLE